MSWATYQAISVAIVALVLGGGIAILWDVWRRP